MGCAEGARLFPLAVGARCKGEAPGKAQSPPETHTDSMKGSRCGKTEAACSRKVREGGPMRGMRGTFIFVGALLLQEGLAYLAPGPQWTVRPQKTGGRSSLPSNWHEARLGEGARRRVKYGIWADMEDGAEFKGNGQLRSSKVKVHNDRRAGPGARRRVDAVENRREHVRNGALLASLVTITALKPKMAEAISMRMDK